MSNTNQSQKQSALELDGLTVTAIPVHPVSASVQPQLEVIAPAALPEGYTFEAAANDQIYTVKVPVGGVVEGQKFCVPLTASESATPSSSVPTGHWKDGLCDCFRHGVCHPMLWNALCCRLIAVGQVMRRLHLTVCGLKGTEAQASQTFRTLVLLTIGFIVAEIVLSGIQQSYVDFATGRIEDGYYVVGQALQVVSFAFLLISVFIVTKTRRHIRDEHEIPQQTCHGCEDCCCAFWCQCCAVAQMARHTADYDTYAANCCSETGLPARAPGIVPGRSEGGFTARAPEIV